MDSRCWHRQLALASHVSCYLTICCGRDLPVRLGVQVHHAITAVAATLHGCLIE